MCEHSESETTVPSPGGTFGGWELDDGGQDIPSVIAQEVLGIVETGGWPTDGGDDAVQIESLTFLSEYLIGLAAAVGERIGALRQQRAATCSEHRK